MCVPVTFMADTRCHNTHTISYQFVNKNEEMALGSKVKRDEGQQFRGSEGCKLYCAITCHPNASQSKARVVFRC